MSVVTQSTAGLPLAVVVTTLLSLAGFLYVQLSRNASIKRIVWPIVVVAFGVAFLYIPLHDPQFGWPFSGLMAIPLAFLYFRFVFCPVCGRTIRRNGLFGKPEFCSKCGAKLNPDA